MTTQMKQWRVSKPTLEPKPYQIRGMELLVQNNGARLFLKPGSGKTATVLKAFDILRKKGIVDTLLVIAPLRVITTSWPQEIDRWADFEHLTYSIVHGGVDGRRGGMEKKSDIYLMNVEGLLTKEWRCPEPVTARQRRYPPNPYSLSWLKGRRAMLVVDESTKFKDSGSQRFKTLKSYLPEFYRSVIMTGTPRPGSLEDLFAQCYITDMGDDLGEFVTHFRHRYMMPDPHNTRCWVEQPNAANKVAEIIAPTTLQIQIEEAVERVENDIWIPMPKELRAQYNALAREFMLVTADMTIMAPNAGVLFGKLRQFAQGAVFDAEHQWHEVHQLKLDVLENILAELNGEPAFCLYHYSHDYERIETRLKSGVPRVGGGISANLGKQYCQMFSSGTLPLLLGHPQSVALGVDGLQKCCNNVIWFAATPSWEQTYQAELRIARQGSKADTVSIHRILLECGVERAIVAKSRERSMSEADFLATLREQIGEEV